MYKTLIQWKLLLVEAVGYAPTNPPKRNFQHELKAHLPNTVKVNDFTVSPLVRLKISSQDEKERIIKLTIFYLYKE